VKSINGLGREQRLI